jgi:predicted MFS family arabinose efflux permease
VQSNVSDALRGRVMALYVTVFAGSTPIGGIFAGLVAEHADARAGFWWGAIASLAVLLLVAWRMRAALRAGRLGKTRLGGLEPTADAT